MKGIKIMLTAAALTAAVAGTADAILITIGEATYQDSQYKLIWDNDGPNGSVVWLDYSNPVNTWGDQVAWAMGLGGNLTIALNPGYTIAWTDSSWRLPTTVDGVFDDWYDGATTAGYNITSSEFGHLYYTELGNKGYFDTSGTFQSDWGLKNVGDFEHLNAYWYWSGTDSADRPGTAWNFDTNSGYQNENAKATYTLLGMAVRSGQVEVTPVPEPSSLLLVGGGLGVLAGVARKRRSSKLQQ